MPYVAEAIDGSSSDLVFPAGDGSMRTEEANTERVLRSAMRFHDLRHTAATLMLRAGVDPHRVQRVLRHASVTTTTGTYAHLAIEDLRDAVNRIAPQAPKRAPFADTPGSGVCDSREHLRKTAEERGFGGRAWQESNLRPAASKFVRGSLPQRPPSPDPSRYEGLAVRRLPRTSRRTRTIPASLLH
jgi:hypothetical protein